MKAICKNCAQREVGCDTECADCRQYRAKRRGRLEAIITLLFGMRKADELLAINAERIGAAQPKETAQPESVTINGVIFVPIRR